MIIIPAKNHDSLFFVFLKNKRHLHSKYTAAAAATSATSYLLSIIFWFKMGRDFCRYMLYLN
jgi:hypothetical protein